VGADGLAYRFKRPVMKQLNIHADDIEMIIAQFGLDMKEVEDLLRVV
jgi:hypothetical protein